ncbi:unnamed protein product [Rhodiola kirilowii]
MVVFLYYDGTHMSAFRLWICLGNLQLRSWWPRICMGMSGAFDTFLEVNPVGICFKVGGECICQLKKACSW